MNSAVFLFLLLFLLIPTIPDKEKEKENEKDTVYGASSRPVRERVTFRLASECRREHRGPDLVQR